MNNSLTVGGFDNFAGVNAMNLNTGIGASQNANSSIAVSMRDTGATPQ